MNYDTQAKVNFDYVIAKYDLLSRTFVELMESINGLHEETGLGDRTVAPSPISKVRVEKTDRSRRSESSVNDSITKPNNRSYLQETFTVKMGKENVSNNKMHSANRSTKKPSARFAAER